MDYISALGLTAGVLTTSAVIPQLIKIINTKSTRDISIYTFLMVTTGIFLWLVYGLIIKSMPLVAANSFSLAFNFAILCLKIKYK